MMDESLFGKRDKRGDWKPFKLIEYPPVFVWPTQGGKLLKWVFGCPGYILPYNLFYALVAIALWFLLSSTEAMKSFSISWIGYLFALNTVIVIIFYGGVHLRLYILRRQGKCFKYNSNWPSTDSPNFLFRNQTIDNMIWTFASAIPIATTYEVLTLWAFANGYVPVAGFEEHPLYFIVLMLLIPNLHELHFYLIHRLIHWPPLYNSIHKLHHNNVNPGPWSGLAMHPVEHLLYFSGVFIYWVVPAHPIHALFHFIFALLTPAPGHVGFEKVVLADGRAFDTDCYAHYLHHKYFECNYSDGVVPLDKWFGTFHDGSQQAQERMDKRLLERARKKGERDARRTQRLK
jgi:sterol desaturase/sphingolipid hydroxylase (fatty acid hydroxylase superfamily)